MKTKNKYILLISLVVGLIGVDLLTKFLCEGIDLNIISNFFVLKSVHNYGAGLGILSGKTMLLIVLSVVFLVAFVVYDVFFKKNNTLYVISLSFIFAGAIGNLIDRIFLGYVRDFLFVNIKLMPYYFNIADVLLTFGMIMFVIDILFFDAKNRKKSTQNSMKISSEIVTENKNKEITTEKVIELTSEKKFDLNTQKTTQLKTEKSSEITIEKSVENE